MDAGDWEGVLRNPPTQATLESEQVLFSKVLCVGKREGFFDCKRAMKSFGMAIWQKLNMTYIWVDLRKIEGQENALDKLDL